MTLLCDDIHWHARQGCFSVCLAVYALHSNVKRHFPLCCCCGCRGGVSCARDRRVGKSILEITQRAPCAVCRVSSLCVRDVQSVSFVLGTHASVEVKISFDPHWTRVDVAGLPLLPLLQGDSANAFNPPIEPRVGRAYRIARAYSGPRGCTHFALKRLHCSSSGRGDPCG